jgi:hypothetical protein
MDRRRFLRRSAVLTGGFVRLGTALPRRSLSQLDSATKGASGPPSMSRQFARWVAGLRYEDLPPVVIDRAKGVTLHALASALQGFQLPAGQEAIRIITGEPQQVPNGATILVQGIRLTRGMRHLPTPN